jgi:hypothetical protein
MNDYIIEPLVLLPKNKDEIFFIVDSYSLNTIQKINRNNGR